MFTASEFTQLMEIVLTILTLSAVFWPAIVLAPLGGKRRALLRPMLAAWVFCALLRSAQALTGTSSFFIVIPEAFDTIAFWATGALLLGLYVLTKIRQRRALYRKAGDVRRAEDLLNLSAAEFERLVVELFHMRGHEARRTGRTGDHGVDVAVKAKNGEKWVVQCKRWRGNVGEPVVRDFYGAMQHEKADRGFLVSTSGFSQAAQVWARGKPITLMTGAEFVRYWQQSHSKPPSVQDQLAPYQLS